MRAISCIRRGGGDALDFLKRNDVDVVFLDVWLPDIDGVALLEQINQIAPEISVIISGHGSIDIAVKSTKLGAFDFLEKPPSMERIITSLNNALERIRLRRENIQLRREAQQEDEMLGNSPEIAEIRRVIDAAAATTARVFITGDNGTGKELVARSIFRKSKRSDRPFIKVNCAAIPGELIESELFGHEKGSFTGAVARRLGRFELAHGGTIFLDEVCDMSPSAQAKVLRVLQEQQFERVGGAETINVDVRVISATNIDVKAAIDEGKFRKTSFTGLMLFRYTCRRWPNGAGIFNNHRVFPGKIFERTWSRHKGNLGRRYGVPGEPTVAGQYTAAEKHRRASVRHGAEGGHRHARHKKTSRIVRGEGSVRRGRVVAKKGEGRFREGVYRQGACCER